MEYPKYKALKGLHLGALISLVLGVVLAVVFREPAGTGVALLSVAFLWGSRLVVWWKSRSK